MYIPNSYCKPIIMDITYFFDEFLGELHYSGFRLTTKQQAFATHVRSFKI